MSRRAPPLERMMDAFSEPEPQRDGRPAGISAVLLPLYETADGPALLYTKRSTALRSHPGEISFPGGRVDPDDADPRAAAVREAREEVGLDPALMTRVSHLVDYLTFRNTVVCAYVARVDGAPPTGPASLEEVEELLLVPLETLL
ncbi:MAG: CoA pyrophosphatase, partial [Candidatus Thermoplasmatota archaeon]